MSIQKKASWTTLLLIATISAAGAAATWWQDHGISELLDVHALESVQSIQKFAEESKRRELELKSEILATNPGFVGYISQAMAAGAVSGGSVDSASIRDLLEERRKLYGFDVAAVLDPRGNSVVMLGDALRKRQDFSSLPLLLRVRASARAESELIGQEGRLVLATLSPMLRGTTIEALLLTGVEIGDAFIQPIARAGKADLALVGTSSQGYVVVASTLDSAENQAIVDAVAAELPVLPGAGIADVARHYDLELAGATTRAASTPLFGAAAGGVLVSIVPVEQRVVITGAIRTPMLIAGAAVLIVLLAVWVLVQARLVHPVNQLVEISDRVLRGDIQVVARDVGKGDLSLIAAAFNQALAGMRGYKEAIEKRQAKS